MVEVYCGKTMQQIDREFLDAISYYNARHKIYRDTVLTDAFGEGVGMVLLCLRED